MTDAGTSPEEEIEALRTALGPFGFQWLCACAVYPALQFGLSVHLGRRLAQAVRRPEPDGDEHRALFRHRWFRQGFIPRVRRRLLVQRIDPALERVVREAIFEMLDRLASAEGGSRLPLRRRPDLWRRLTDALLTDDTERGPLMRRLARAVLPPEPQDGDRVYVAFMTGGRVQPEDLKLPPSLARRLRLTLRRALGVDVLLTGGATLLACAGCAALAFGPLPQLVYPPDVLRVLSVEGDGALLPPRRAEAILDWSDWATVATLEGHGDWVRSIPFSPDGARLATVSADGTARLWDAATGEPLATLEGHGESVRSLAFSPDGARLAMGSDEGTARLWDAATGEPLATLEGHGESVRSLAFSPDGARLATGSVDGTARLWDAAMGKALATLNGHRWPVSSVAFSPDGTRLATGSDDGTARLWDATTGAPLAILEGHRDRVRSVAFSPDGARLATGSADGTARLWDAITGAPLATLVGHRDRVRSAAFSPDGARLATWSDDGTARLWNAATGEPLATLEGHEHWVWSVAFSPDGTRLVTGSDDGTARLWDVPTGEALAILEGREEGVRSVAFSPDGTRLATGSADGTARLWAPLVRDVNAEDFLGEWVNIDPDPGDITRIEVAAAAGGTAGALLVQTYGSCSPTDCVQDSVIVEDDIEDGVVDYTRGDGFAISDATLILPQPDRLVLRERRRFTDGSNREDRENATVFERPAADDPGLEEGGAPSTIYSLCQWLPVC
ncbi:WD40 repeat domain-containing protein [Jannaschia formosa]|uniref:WD40 repeat domain-containing protein n=1 Tax=Jannaschia formosa TaxID=2259592 RepID=UPI000E1B7D0B|nr:WD40 repeat domain-containing protein [Jannaschia formosa]TFL16042.1 hypothetical protein DR046_22100 [Jannaschia formosa]